MTQLTELERLRAAATSPGDFTVDEPVVPLQVVEAIIESALHDAQRYRWLRDHAPDTSQRGKIGVFIGMGSVYSGFRTPYREHTDQIVDMAADGVDLNDIHRQRILRA